MTIAPRYYHHIETQFGTCLIAATPTGITNIVLGDSKEETLRELSSRLPTATLIAEHLPIHDIAAQACTAQGSASKKSTLPALDISGTPFQLAVWRALQNIPTGTTRTYAEIAAAIGRPSAVRAVGSAIGANPVAILIPCHRVLRTDGTLGGYRWGEQRKRALLTHEGATFN